MLNFHYLNKIYSLIFILIYIANDKYGRVIKIKTWYATEKYRKPSKTKWIKHANSKRIIKHNCRKNDFEKESDRFKPKPEVLYCNILRYFERGSYRNIIVADKISIEKDKKRFYKAFRGDHCRRRIIIFHKCFISFNWALMSERGRNDSSPAYNFL